MATLLLSTTAKHRLDLIVVLVISTAESINLILQLSAPLAVLLIESKNRRRKSATVPVGTDMKVRCGKLQVTRR